MIFVANPFRYYYYDAGDYIFLFGLLAEIVEELCIPTGPYLDNRFAPYF